MKQFRRLALEVQAVQWLESEHRARLLGGRDLPGTPTETDPLTGVRLKITAQNEPPIAVIDTPTGERAVRDGDWIVRSAAGVVMSILPAAVFSEQYIDADKFGPPVAQESKYTIDAHGRIVNRQTGAAIPDDEPIMIFRAQDEHARAIVRHYCDLVAGTAKASQSKHGDVCFERYQRFVDFAEKHPERMKTPD